MWLEGTSHDTWSLPARDPGLDTLTDVGVVVTVVAVVVAVGCYLTWLAGRLDRLGVRVEAARASLDAALVRRAAAAQALAQARLATPAGSASSEGLPADDLSAAAQAALQATPEAREGAESELTQAMRALVTASADGMDAVQDAAVSAATRVQLARQFHNDAVFASLALRRRRLVRWLRLFGRAQPPAYFEIDDSLR